jgi:lipid-binding SYLF domain-containing protein
MPHSLSRALTLIVFTLVTACATSGATTPAQKRQAVLNMKQEVLADLYQARPEARTKVKNAPGYAVFSNANINVLLASFSGGQGVVKDNASGKHTFMKMGEVGIGVGMGVKDFRAVFVFHDRSTMQNFVDHGWEVGGHADAAAKAGETGGALAGELLLDGVTVYQLTENGLALQATVKGTKYWKDTELN